MINYGFELFIPKKLQPYMKKAGLKEFVVKGDALSVEISETQVKLAYNPTAIDAPHRAS